MRVTLIRHGESEANVGEFISDDPRRPVNLTARGIAQAQALAAAISHELFTHAYVSEFPRAQQTLAILLQGRLLVPVVDARLNERKSGLDGQPVHVFNDEVRRNPLHYKTAHGETFLEQMERLRSFLDDMALRHPQGRILLVSHENPILAAKGLTTSAPEVVLAALPNCGRVDINWPHS